jgi:hypothetical protein
LGNLGDLIPRLKAEKRQDELELPENLQTKKYIERAEDKGAPNTQSCNNLSKKIINIIGS